MTRTRTGLALVAEQDKGRFLHSCEVACGVALRPDDAPATVGDLYELICMRAATGTEAGALIAATQAFRGLCRHFEGRGCGQALTPETSLLSVLDPDLRREWQALRAAFGPRLRPLDLGEPEVGLASFAFAIGVVAATAVGLLVGERLGSAWYGVAAGSGLMAVIFLALEVYARAVASRLPADLVTLGDLAQSLSAPDGAWRRLSRPRASPSALWTALTETIRRETGFTGPITRETPVFARSNHGHG